VYDGHFDTPLPFDGENRALSGAEWQLLDDKMGRMKKYHYSVFGLDRPTKI
jgi:hypothetical protein